MLFYTKWKAWFDDINAYNDSLAAIASPSLYPLFDLTIPRRIC